MGTQQQQQAPMSYGMRSPGGSGQPDITTLVGNAARMGGMTNAALTAPQGSGPNITDLVRLAGQNQRQQGMAMGGMQGQGVGSAPRTPMLGYGQFGMSNGTASGGNK
jgi:hypothetical protein